MKTWMPSGEPLWSPPNWRVLLQKLEDLLSSAVYYGSTFSLSFSPLHFPLVPTPGPLFTKLYISQEAWPNRAVFLTYLEDWGSSCPLLLRCSWGRTCISARSYDSLGFSNKIIASWSHKAVPAQALKVGRRESVSSCFCLPANQIFPPKLSGDIFLCSIGQQCILHP